MTKICKCKKTITGKFSEKEKQYFFFCPDCQIGGKAATEKEAAAEFEKAIRPGSATNPVPVIPKKTQLPAWIKAHENKILDHAAGFVEKPALKKMLKINLEYVMTADLKKAWETEEGVKSIISALDESLQYAATIGQTGSIVPFGGAVEFIPAVECFQSALTTGKNAPCKKVVIDCIYENDQYEISTKDGNFSYEMKKISLPRGDVVGVVVMAEKQDGSVIGNVYDVDRLMQKAEQHSAGYKYYLQDIRALKKAQSEGKDFIEKWGKKFYAEDITNPYANADKPEMLKKLAGKSFLYPLFKEKMINAVIDEQDGTHETAAETRSSNPIKIIDRSMDAFNEISAQTAEKIIDGEIIKEDAHEAEKQKNVDSRKTVNNSNDELFE